MTDSSHNHPTRIRTFAGDLDIERKKRELKAPGSETTAIEKKHPESKPSIPPAPTKHVEPDRKQTKQPEVIKEPHFTVSTEPNRPPIKIPAFHELQKHVAPIQKSELPKKKKRISYSTNKKTKPTPVRANIGFDATVITDTKSERFKFFPSLFKSIQDWIKKLSVARKKKAEPKYTIPETERRKGVIQKATSKSGTIFTADNETLKEQIRKRRQQETIKSDESETTWSPYTEIGYNLLEKPEQRAEPQNVVVEFTKTTKPSNKPSAIVDDTDALDESRWNSPASEPVLTEPTAPEVVPKERDSEPAVIPEAETFPDETPKEEASPVQTEQASETQPEIPKPQNSKSHSNNIFNRTDTNTLTVVLLITILGFVVILFAARTVIKQFSIENEVVNTNLPAVELILQNAKLVEITLTVDTVDTLPSLLTDTIETAPAGLIEIPLLSPVGDEVTASYIFALLNYHTLPAFRQALTSVRFVSVNHSKPAMLLQFVDRNTVLGGFLAWETTMSADIHNLYGTPDQPTNSFIDGSIKGTDVRILKHEGAVVLVYGIIDDNTALVTSNEADFSQIIELGTLD